MNSDIQEGSVYVWKENMLENLERGLLEYKNIEEFLADIRKEFGEGNEKLVKVAELRRKEKKQWSSLYRSSEKQQEKADIRGGY